MSRAFSAFCLSLAVVACAFSLGPPPAKAGGSNEGSIAARFGDNYEGYHLRPPYYLPGLGWHTPPEDNHNRALYYGYHFHESAPPLTIYDVNRRESYGRVSARDHVAWCFDRYGSYRVSDNSFQPNHGPRRPCQSPFD